MQSIIKDMCGEKKPAQHKCAGTSFGELIEEHTEGQWQTQPGRGENCRLGRMKIAVYPSQQ